MLTLEHLAELATAQAAAAAQAVREFELGGRRFAFNARPALMGVINLSPDSWYRESVRLSAESAIERGCELVAQGADLVDLGAESTLAHAARLADVVQSNRLLPVVRGLRQAGVLVSVESYQPAVARACLEAGANVLNLTGTRGSEEMYRLVAEHRAAVIICYVQGANVREVEDFDFGADPVSMMQDYFAREAEQAHGRFAGRHAARGQRLQELGDTRRGRDRSGGTRRARAPARGHAAGALRRSC